jgi:hypothetical protein
MKNAVFWDVTPASSCKNRRFGSQRPSVLVTTRFVPSSPILVTLMKKAIRSS